MGFGEQGQDRERSGNHGARLRGFSSHRGTVPPHHGGRVFGLGEAPRKPRRQEAKFLAEQFEKINQKLEGIRDEIDQIALELQRTSMNKQNFDYEAKIISQYEKFQDFVNAKPKFQGEEEG